MLESGLEGGGVPAERVVRDGLRGEPLRGGFPSEAKRLEIVPALSTRVTGFNINGGRRLDIGAYAVSQ